MEAADALEELGLAGPAGPEDVKRAYRRLARTLHPDTGGDAARFRRVQRAYETIRDGTDARVDGPRPQVRVAGVDERWWESPGAWHEQPVDVEGVELDRAPDGRATAADLDLVASLLHAPRDPPVRRLRLHSRSPGSRLHRFVTMLDPDLLASIDVGPASDGRRAGHDVALELRAPGGKGRRLLADVALPTDWNRRRGSDTVSMTRTLRPCRDPAETAVRTARAVAELTEEIGWPLQEWFVLRA